VVEVLRGGTCAAISNLFVLFIYSHGYYFNPKVRNLLSLIFYNLRYVHSIRCVVD